MGEMRKQGTFGALEPLAGPARRAASELASLPSGVKDRALAAMADALVARSQEIVAANREDLDRAREEGRPAAVVDRLAMDQARVAATADGVRQVAALKDPIGQVIEGWTLPNGLRVEKVRVPLGVIGVIYEGRPNVTVDAGVLAVKAGNAVLLRGSRTAERTNAVLAQVMQEAGEREGLPAG